MFPKSLKGLLLLNETALLALVVITGTLGGMWAYYWQQSSEEAVRINALLHDAEQIRGDMYRQLKEVNRARLTEDPSALTVYASYAERIERLFKHLYTQAQDADERLAINYMQETFGIVQTDMDKVFTDPYEISDAVRMKLLDPDYEEALLGDFESALRVFSEVVAVRRQTLANTVQRWRRLAWFIIPTPILVAGALLLLSHRSLRAEFVEPMGALSDGAVHLSEGDLAHRIEPRGVREVAALATTFNKMASDLNASRDALVESERQAALGSLVPVVAHNIRNPLASIRAGAQLIDAGDDRDELHQTRDEIIESVDRLERWVSALLSYLHPLQPHLADTSLAVVVDGALAPLKPKLDDKSIRIERRGWQHSPSCSVDSDLLEQAIYGLLNNAVDASPAESSIALAVRADRDTAVLTIDDHGPGIAFDPNPHDLTPGPSTKRFGTGLGIPFAFKICQAHGGQIEINPRASGGTRALLRLPLSPRERAS